MRKRTHKMMETGGFGLERETLRVTRDGLLSQTAHPFSSPHLTRDFCENQLEIVTPVCDRIAGSLSALRLYDHCARRHLAHRGETLWLYSNPPRIDSDEEIVIARFAGSDAPKSSYREKLAARYGKRIMLYCGIHFNVSFPRDFLGTLYREAGSTLAMKDFASRLYLHVLQGLMRHSWLLTALSAASPVYDASLLGKETGTRFSGDGSMRGGEKGYWNTFTPLLDYSSPAAYADSIEAYVRRGILYAESEVYLPVRPKAPGENTLSRLRRYGIDHLEMRMFDLNPLEPLGIDPRTLSFAYLLMQYLTYLPPEPLTPADQVAALRAHKQSARFDLSDTFVGDTPLLSRAEEVFADMRRTFSEDENALALVDFARETLTKARPCERILEKLCVDEKK